MTKASSTTTLTSKQATSSYGQFVTLTAKLAAKFGGVPSGTVTFYAGSLNLGASTVASGAASLATATLPVGVDSVTAVYGGDSNLTASTSAAVKVTVAKATPAITWAQPAAIAKGVALSALQLNATASVPGAFIYKPATGTVLAAGARLVETARLGGSEYEVHLYRPRIEGTFARIERWRNVEDPTDSFWRSIDRANVSTGADDPRPLDRGKVQSSLAMPGGQRRDPPFGHRTRVAPGSAGPADPGLLQPGDVQVVGPDRARAHELHGGSFQERLTHLGDGTHDQDVAPLQVFATQIAAG